MSPPTTTILIGNPGVGKSTMLNCLIGKLVHFKSGVSFGSGLTQFLHVYEAEDGSRFMDTPGLSDIAIRQQAAGEIEKALRSGGIFKVIFVLTLESGRVKPDDKTVMQLVLESAPDIAQDKYSILINKVPPPTVNKLLSNSHHRLELAALLNSGLTGTFSIYYNKKINELEDVEDGIVGLDDDLLTFINNAPTISIEKDNVKAIKYGNYEKVFKELAAQLEALRVDNNSLQQQIQKQAERLALMEERHKQEMQISEEVIRSQQHMYDVEIRSVLQFQEDRGVIKEIEKAQKEIDDRNKKNPINCILQ